MLNPDSYNIAFSMIDDMYNYPKYIATCIDRGVPPLTYPEFATMLDAAQKTNQVSTQTVSMGLHVLTEPGKANCCGGGKLR